MKMRNFKHFKIGDLVVVGKMQDNNDKGLFGKIGKISNRSDTDKDIWYVKFNFNVSTVASGSSVTAFNKSQGVFIDYEISKLTKAEAALFKLKQ